MIGNVDVKASSVFFYVKRKTPFSDVTKTIPYESTEVNIGNAIDINTGVFKAPVNGRYFFSFSGLVEFTAAGKFWISLMKNGVQDGSSAVHQPAAGTSYLPVTLQTTFDLKKGDTIAMKIANAFSQPLQNSKLYDSDDKYTHFTGYLLEQDFS